jgi:hypothetical protein
VTIKVKLYYFNIKNALFWIKLYIIYIKNVVEDLDEKKKKHAKQYKGVEIEL